MKTKNLSFEQVCEQYEFAVWELAELVEQGEIAGEMTNDGQRFSHDEILRFFRATPCHMFSLKVANHIYGKDEKTLRRQAKLGKLRGKRISYVWATNATSMDEYMAKYARNV